MTQLANETVKQKPERKFGVVLTNRRTVKQLVPVVRKITVTNEDGSLKLDPNTNEPILIEIQDQEMQDVQEPSAADFYIHHEAKRRWRKQANLLRPHTNDIRVRKTQEREAKALRAKLEKQAENTASKVFIDVSTSRLYVQNGLALPAPFSGGDVSRNIDTLLKMNCANALFFLHYPNDETYLEARAEDFIKKEVVCTRCHTAINFAIKNKKPEYKPACKC